jgi:tetratricopeptide (TPR) repeat protein
MRTRLSSSTVSPRLRTYATVAVAAIAAAGLVVGTVAFTRTSTAGGGSAHAQTTGPAQKRPPALVLDLGVRTDAEARALRRANVLYDRGARARAAAVFARYRSVEAEVGEALARWPTGTVAALERLAAEHPANGLVLLHLGLARFADGDAKAGKAAWRRAVRLAPDTESAVQAEQLLHPELAPGRPPFIPSFSAPAAVLRLSPARQLAAFRDAARAGGFRAHLLYGAALQRLGRSVSAEQQFRAAARLAPADAETRVAAAVGRFTKANPAAAFSRLGPLARIFPRSQSVRFHLGELLLWIRQVGQAKQELREAVQLGTGTILGRTSTEFLRQLATVR